MRVLNPAVQALADHIDALQDEVERLRAALAHTIWVHDPHHANVGCEQCKYALEQAEKAP